MKPAFRNELIEPFYVMEVTKAASEMEKTLGPNDLPMIQLTLGEPDFTAPELVRKAAIETIEKGATHYTSALGIDPLREKIAAWYGTRFDVDIDPKRVVVTAGASAALQLTCLALVDVGSEVIMSDPCYPCNRHFVTAADGKAVAVPVGPKERFQLSAEQVRNAWTEKTAGVLLASPSNPTGTSIEPDELRRIHEVAQEKGGFTIVDELYLGLSHDERFGQTALAISDEIISINSFSKYFSMTGWRLGWTVVPERLVPTMEALCQNFYICPSTIAQHAALTCFEPESIEEYERRRREFKARRDVFVPGLEEIGFKIPVVPDGAFYVWADCSPFFEKLGVKDSWDFAFEVMKRTHVAFSPGKDFGRNGTDKFVRFSIANSMENLQESLRRFKQALA